MDDLVSGVLTRISELERLAQAATQGAWEWRDAGGVAKYALTATAPGQRWPGSIVVPSLHPDAYPSKADADLIAAHGPDSVLRLCRAHRQIVEQYQRAQELLTDGRFTGSVAESNEAAARSLRVAVEALAVGLGVVEEASDGT